MRRRLFRGDLVLEPIYPASPAASQRPNLLIGILSPLRAPGSGRRSHSSLLLELVQLLFDGRRDELAALTCRHDAAQLFNQRIFERHIHTCH